MLKDSHGRIINYLRLAVTDRCNLRCSYCMPENGLQWEKRDALLTFEEINRLLLILAHAGITKIRFTGGEPFLRKDFTRLLESVCSSGLFSQVSITTNGTLTRPHIGLLKTLGIDSVNLSADTFNPVRFAQITRRDEVDEVEKTLHSLLDHGIKTRINAVIMKGKNEEDILELAMLTKELPIDVRYIEEMPFNGNSGAPSLMWNYKKILDELISHFPGITRIADPPGSTSMNYHIPGHTGNIGIIAAYTRSFCGTCNRLRITPAGLVKTCLYDKGALDLRALLRSGFSDEVILDSIMSAISKKAINGFEAEANRRTSPVTESMATIGG